MGWCDDVVDCVEDTASDVADTASGGLHEIDNVIEPAHDIPPFQDLTSEYGSPRGASPGAFPVLESRL